MRIPAFKPFCQHGVALFENKQLANETKLTVNEYERSSSI
jgi:hypothetical protein